MPSDTVSLESSSVPETDGHIYYCLVVVPVVDKCCDSDSVS